MYVFFLCSFGLVTFDSAPDIAFVLTKFFFYIVSFNLSVARQVYIFFKTFLFTDFKMRKQELEIETKYYSTITLFQNKFVSRNADLNIFL